MNEKSRERLCRRNLPLFEVFIWVVLFGSAALAMLFTNHILSGLMGILRYLEKGGIS